MPGTRRVLRSKLLSLFSFTLQKRTEFPKPLISCNPVTTLHRSLQPQRAEEPAAAISF